MKIDLIMLTWNSNKPYFKQCLKSIKRAVPTCHFIVIDRFSTDGTLKTIKEVFLNTIIIQSNANLAKARKLGIGYVDTEYFIFIDDSIELCPGWFKEITSNLKDDVGAIHGDAVTTVDYIAKLYGWYKWKEVKRPFLRKNQMILEATAKNPDDIRGYLHNTLIRTNLAKDWNPPNWLCAYEDHHLLRHIVSKGYKWKVLPTLEVKHHDTHSIKHVLEKARWNKAGERLIKYKNITLQSLIRNLITGSIGALIASMETGKPMIIPLRILQLLGDVQGYVGWSKYLVLER